MITVIDTDTIKLGDAKEADNKRSYLVILPPLEIQRRRVAVLIDTSYSMEGKLLYRSLKNVEELINVFEYHSVNYKLYIFYKEIEEIEVYDIEKIRPKSGTNLKNLIQFLVNNRDNYDVSIIFTDGVPTIGPKSLQKIASNIGDIDVIEDAVLLVNPNNNRDYIKNLADALKLRVLDKLEKSVHDNIANILVVSSIVPSLIVRLGFGHPEWIKIEAPFLTRATNGWSISNISYFQLFNIPVPVTISPNIEVREKIGIPIMVKKLLYDNGKSNVWKLAGLLEYT